MAARASTMVACAFSTAYMARPYSRCSSDPDRRATVRRKRERSEPINPCEEYNSLKWRMSYASRKDDCNAQDGCVFVGRSITGACTPRDPSVLHERSTARSLPNVPIVLPDSKGSAQERKAVLRRQYTARVMSESIEELETEFEEKKDDTLAANRFRELMDALDVDEGAQELALAILKEEGLQAVQAFVKSQLANAAAEELRYQKTATEAFAKDFLIQVVHNPDLPGQMGHMLESVFKDPALSAGIRRIIYNGISLDHTYQSSWRLTQPLVTWLLTGTDWMDDEAIKLCTYLIKLHQTELATIGLVAWAVNQPEMLDGLASKALAESIPYGSEQLTETAVWAVTTTLESDWALELAKSTVLEMIEATKGAGDQGGQSPPPTNGARPDGVAADRDAPASLDRRDGAGAERRGSGQGSEMAGSKSEYAVEEGHERGGGGR